MARLARGMRSNAADIRTSPPRSAACWATSPSLAISSCWAVAWPVRSRSVPGERGASVWTSIAHTSPAPGSPWTWPLWPAMACRCAMALTKVRSRLPPAHVLFQATVTTADIQGTALMPADFANEAFGTWLYLPPRLCPGQAPPARGLANAGSQCLSLTSCFPAR